MEMQMLIKQLITILLVTLSSLVFAQPDNASWLNVTVQTDQYGAETSWEILMGGEVVAISPLYQNSTLSNVTIPLPAGDDYEFIIYDSFGDGICCDFGAGWYSLTNTCGLEIFNYEFNSASDTTGFNLFPCLPVLFGCTSESANNYNPWATVDDGNCNVSECPEGETLVTMELTLDNWPNETGFTLVNLAVGEFYEQVFPGEFDFGDQLATYTYDFCVSLGFELVLVDTFGDGLNGIASGGEANGAVVITSCQDSILWELEDVAFAEFEGGTMYSGAVFTEPCPPVPPIYGCMDDDYVDYNPLATTQDTCEVLHTWGCMNSEAFNYDNTATISDFNSPCPITITLEDDAGDGWGMSGIGLIQEDQQWLFTMGPGQFQESWEITLDSDEEVDIYYFQEGGQQSSAQELAFQTLHNSVLVTNIEGDTLLSEGANPFLNNGQGALQPFRAPDWNVYSFIPKCGDSCEPFTYGCTDESAQNYNTEINTEDGSCYYQSGCTQAGYLEYYTQGYEADYDNGSCDIIAVFGCMDNTAFNYNEEANVETECTPVIVGCMNDLAFNYNSNANTAGECIPFIYGCTDPTMFNYDTEANTDNNSCLPYIYGCTISTAFNYDSMANTDNGSCIEIVEGCADIEAVNYNSLVNIPDNDMCLYDAGCIGEPGDPYYLNDSCYAWIIDIDPYCCEVGWDAACVNLYEYCEQGWPTGIPEINTGINLYPNPTSTVLNIQTSLDVFTEVYSSLGQLVVSGTKEKRIDLRDLPKGLYQVVIDYNGRKVNKKITKL